MSNQFLVIWIVSNQFPISKINFMLYVLIFELVICKSIKDTKIWGQLTLICGQSNFDGEVVKHHKNLDHDSIKHFLVFFQVKLCYIFFCYFFGCFGMKLFLVKFFKWIYLPCPLQNFHQTSSIKPCLVPSLPHCLQNLLLMNHHCLKLWMTSMYILI